MKIISNIIESLKDVTGIFYKKTRNAEKQQEIEAQKLYNFNYYIANAFIILLVLLIIDSIFNLSISEYFYEIFEKILNYMINEGS